MKPTPLQFRRQAVLPLLSLFIVWTSIPAAAESRILLEETFEEYTSVPHPLAHGVHGIDDAWEWEFHGFGSEEAGVEVVEGASTGGAEPNQRLLHLKRPEDPRLHLWRTFESVSLLDDAAKVRLRFKFKIGEMEGSSDILVGFLEDGMSGLGRNSYVCIVRIRYQEEQNLSRFYYVVDAVDADGQSERDHQPLDVPLYPNTWYELELHLDLAAQQWGLTLTNLDASAEQTSQVGLPLRRNVNAVSGFGISNRTPPAAMNHFLDDIVVEVSE